MVAGKQAHLAVVSLHQKAADQHNTAADAHTRGAVANRAAGNEPAAKLDDKAATQHQKAAAAHVSAASKHERAAPQGRQRSDNRVKASTASQKAGVASAKAGTATSNAVAADPSSSAPGTPAQQQAATDQVAKGQLAQQSSDQAVAAGIDAAATGHDASDVGSGDGGLINSIVERMNLTGITKTMLDHNRFFTLGLLIAFVLFIVFVFFYGTEPKIDNPFYVAPGSDKTCAVNSSGSGQAIDAILDKEPDLALLKPSDYFTQKRVTEAELKTELQNYLNAGTARIAQLQDDLKLKQQQVAQADAQIETQKAALASALKVVSALAVASAPATGPIGPLIGVVTGLLTAGLAADNARKNSVVSQNPGSETSKE